ncbi:MAG: trypsin-like serine protease [Planctomycetales bacterium]|nr:trypsin-like serine protease [Planctomycetales bacterium]
MSVDDFRRLVTRRGFWFGIVMVISALLPPAVLAVVTSDAAGTHQITPGEPAFGVNLDGVTFLALADANTADAGLGKITPVCTAALITHRHLITAAHCFDPGLDDSAPLPDGLVDEYFRRNPYVAVFDLAGGRTSVPLDLDSVQFEPGWLESGVDIAIVALADPAPVELPRYPLYVGQGEFGQQVVVAGYGATGHGSTGVELPFPPHSTKRAGLNRIEFISDEVVPGVELMIYDFDGGLPETNSLQLNDIPSDLGFGDDEVMVGPGDSGGPIFLSGAIAGIAVSVASFGPDDSVWGDLAMHMRVANSLDFITSATDGEAVFVPEPAASTLALVALMGSFRWGRSRWSADFCRKI